jgi:undecaprenyl-diphosphatase
VTWLKVVILGVVQGLTEFLPVSSSGHLVLARRLLGVTPPAGASGVLWEVVLHMGTLVAVVVVLRREVCQVLTGLVRGLLACRRGVRAALREEPGFALALLIAMGSIPAGVVGVVFKDALEALFEKPTVVAGALLVTGTILFATRYAPKHVGDGRVGWLSAVIVGCAQAVAILPGISRSGATISAGLFAGLERAEAARFSFLLSIPAVGGAGLLELRHLDALPAESLAPFLAGGVVSAVVGLAALVLLLRVVEAGKLHHFAYYCWGVGAGALAWLLVGG